ncbi:hypothetical protein DIPPA_19167 [Diplonema papillatum]|nr:hypothetical protein DIPPA_19167 [Diplonema papillatum]
MHTASDPIHRRESWGGAAEGEPFGCRVQPTNADVARRLSLLHTASDPIHRRESWGGAAEGEPFGCRVQHSNADVARRLSLLHTASDPIRRRESVRLNDASSAGGRRLSSHAGDAAPGDNPAGDTGSWPPSRVPAAAGGADAHDDDALGNAAFLSRILGSAAVPGLAPGGAAGGSQARRPPERLRSRFEEERHQTALSSLRESHQHYADLLASALSRQSSARTSISKP